MTSAGTSSTWVDSELQATDNYINGRQIRFTNNGNDGLLRFVNDYTGSSTTGATRGDVLTDATADGDTYELWPIDLRVARVHRAINRAIRAIPRKGAPPLRDISLHTSTGIKIFAIPTAVVGISNVSYRLNNARKVIHNGDSAWNELGTVANVTTTSDPEDRRQGANSQKMVVLVGAAAGITLASASIPSLDISGLTHCEFFIKSTVATTAANLQLILSNTASAGAETELIDVPALVADTWTWVRVALANPELDTAIISIGLKYTTDIGAATIWIDGVEGTEANSEDWATIHRNNWRIDKDARQLVLKPEAHVNTSLSYSLLRLRGVKKPTELNADATNCDVEPEYIIMKATALLMRQRTDRRAGNRDSAGMTANDYEALAFEALANQQTPNATRWVSD